MLLTIVIPVFNESQMINECLARLQTLLPPARQSGPEDFEIIFSDPGSTDGSIDEIHAALLPSAVRSVTLRLKHPSVGRTVKLGLEQARGEYVLVLPCDVGLERSALSELIEALRRSQPAWGAFPKRYEPTTLFLNVYLWLQNFVRLRILKNAVWTNGFFFRRNLIQEVGWPDADFMEDVMLCDRLKLSGKPMLLKSRLTVSSRRYYPRRSSRRILVNWLIITLFRLGYQDLKRLKAIYVFFK